MTPWDTCATGLRLFIFYCEPLLPEGESFPYKLWVSGAMVMVTGPTGSALGPVDMPVMEVLIAVSNASISKCSRP